MHKSLASKLAGIGSVVAIAGSLAAGPANAAIYQSIRTTTAPCAQTGPRIATTTAGSGFGYLAIRGTCFPAGASVDVVFETDNGPVQGEFWESDAYVIASSDGSFTTPMVWRPQNGVQATEYVYASANPTYLYESNTLTFQVGGTTIIH